MQKHLGRVVRFGWLPTIAFAAMVVSDMSTAVINADKNIATLLKNLGWQQPPQQIATYIWEHPWAAIIVVALIFAVGAGLSWGVEKAWHWLRQKRLTHNDVPIIATTRPANERSTWMPLHEALHYLIYDSEWTNGQTHPKDKADFDRRVSVEMRERLARREIVARGKLGWDDDSLHRASEPIQPDFWIDAHIQPHGEIALAKDTQCAATEKGGKTCYRGVIIARHDVEQTWPRRASSGTNLSPLAQFIEPLRATIAGERAAKEAQIAAVWMPLRDVIKRIAFESEWAHSYDVEYANALIRSAHSLTTEMKWCKDLRQQFLFYAPEMISRGIHQVKGQRPDNGLSDIPADFWQKAEIEVVDMLATDFAGDAYIQKKEVFRDVVFDQKQVDEKWPKSTKTEPTPFKTLIEPWLQDAEYNAGFNEAAWGNIA